ncbi:MAG: LOG family protein [Bacteroidetes bacterium]|nr:LOG family protein [Bacteroidota bacterium]
MSETQTPQPAQGKIVTIFGSSRPVEGSKEYEEAEILGKKLSSAGISVCTGGYGGIMEAVSRGASESDVKIIGVTSATFSPTPNKYVNVQVHARSHFERLEKLVEIGDAYVILRGGTGTLVEFAMVWELMNKNLIGEKPIILVGDFWKPVVNLMGKALIAEGHESRTGYVRMVASASQAAETLIASLSLKEHPAV